MALRWTQSALADLHRIHDFLEPVNPAAAVRAARAVVARARRIPAQPRLGEKLGGFPGRDVRRVLVAGYEIRYELAATAIVVLRVFHTRERR